jgi:hypothetical protein
MGETLAVLMAYNDNNIMSEVVQMDNTAEESDRTIKRAEGSNPSLIHLYLMLYVFFNCIQLVYTRTKYAHNGLGMVRQSQRNFGQRIYCDP